MTSAENMFGSSKLPESHTDWVPETAEEVFSTVEVTRDGDYMDASVHTLDGDRMVDLSEEDR